MLELWIGVKAARYFPCTRSSSRLNVGHVPTYNNGKFVPTSLLRHPRRDITYIAFHYVLMGKVYYIAAVRHVGVKVDSSPTTTLLYYLASLTSAVP